MKGVEYDRRQEAPRKKFLKLRQTSTCGYKTLIPEVPGNFMFLLPVCGPILRPSYVVHDDGKHHPLRLYSLCNQLLLTAYFGAGSSAHLCVHGVHHMV